MLQGRTFQLKPLSSGDVEPLYVHACLRPEEWTRLGVDFIPNPQQFAQLLWGRTQALYLVASLPDGQPTATVAVYDTSLVHGTAWIDVSRLVTDPNVQLDAPTDAVVAVVDLLFDRWRVRKVFCAHALYADPPLSRLKGVTTEEGIIKDYYLHDGAHWDRIITSIDREAWLTERSSLLEAVGVAAG